MGPELAAYAALGVVISPLLQGPRVLIAKKTRALANRLDGRVDNEADLAALKEVLNLNLMAKNITRGTLFACLQLVAMLTLIFGVAAVANALMLIFGVLAVGAPISLYAGREARRIEALDCSPELENTLMMYRREYRRTRWQLSEPEPDRGGLSLTSRAGGVSVAAHDDAPVTTPSGT